MAVSTKVKMIKEEASKDIELLKVILKDKRITSAYIGNSYIDFLKGEALVSPKIYALIKESGIEVE